MPLLHIANIRSPCLTSAIRGTCPRHLTSANSPRLRAVVISVSTSAGVRYSRGRRSMLPLSALQQWWVNGHPQFNCTILAHWFRPARSVGHQDLPSPRIWVLYYNCIRNGTVLVTVFLSSVIISPRFPSSSDLCLLSRPSRERLVANIQHRVSLAFSSSRRLGQWSLHDWYIPRAVSYSEGWNVGFGGEMVL
jgi:hypothetical protein